MRIGRTRFVHLPTRVNAVAPAHGVSENPQKSSAGDTVPARTARKAPAARMSPARVLWREVPNWHTLPGNPASEICKGNSAYARAANLHSAPAAGRLANQVA